jgi:hypothetical protein
MSWMRCAGPYVVCESSRWLAESLQLCETRLALLHAGSAIPPLEEINENAGFLGKEITQAEFEAVWERATASRP